MNLVDTHSHLIKNLYKENYNDVLTQTLKETKAIINICLSYKDCKEIIELNKIHPQIFPVVGIHPTDCNDFKESDLEKFSLLINENVVAIGETGLDYYHKNNKQKQKEAFLAHIELATKKELPLIIHSRDSSKDIFEIIKKFPNNKFLLHSWSGDIETTKQFLSLKNVWFGFSGILTFKNAPSTREALKIIPLNRIMFETDSPWLTPEPHRGKRNRPSYVKYVYKLASEILEIKEDKLEQILLDNINIFFERKMP